MPDQPDKIPVDEIKNLAGAVMKENMDIMYALAEYDERESSHPLVTIRMPILNVTSSAFSGSFSVTMQDETSKITNSALQNVNINISSTIFDSYKTSNFTKKNTLDISPLSP